MSKVYFLCEWIEEAERLHDNFYKYDKVESMVHKFFNKQSCDFFGFDGATEWMYYTNKILIYIKTIMKENGLS